jgi:hypothetical protein
MYARGYIAARVHELCMHADIHNGNFSNTYQLRGYACHTRSKP